MNPYTERPPHYAANHHKIGHLFGALGIAGAVAVALLILDQIAAMKAQNAEAAIEAHKAEAMIKEAVAPITSNTESAQ